MLGDGDRGSTLTGSPFPLYSSKIGVAAAHYSDSSTNGCCIQVVSTFEHTIPLDWVVWGGG